MQRSVLAPRRVVLVRVSSGEPGTGHPHRDASKTRLTSPVATNTSMPGAPMWRWSARRTNRSGTRRRSLGGHSGTRHARAGRWPGCRRRARPSPPVRCARHPEGSCTGRSREPVTRRDPVDVQTIGFVVDARLRQQRRLAEPVTTLSCPRREPIERTRCTRPGDSGGGRHRNRGGVTAGTPGDERHLGRFVRRWLEGARTQWW